MSWLLLAIVVANMHHLCTFIYLDVLHLNKIIDIDLGGKYILSGYEFDIPLINIYWIIRDIFPFYNAPENINLDIQYYVFLVGDRMRDAIVAYLLYSSILALATYWHTVHQYSKLYHRIQVFSKVYLFVQIYGLFSYILCMGQFLRGVPILFYSICVFIIFFVRKTNKGWLVKAEL